MLENLLQWVLNRHYLAVIERVTNVTSTEHSVYIESLGITNIFTSLWVGDTFLTLLLSCDIHWRFYFQALVRGTFPLFSFILFMKKSKTWCQDSLKTVPELRHSHMAEWKRCHLMLVIGKYFSWLHW